MTTQRPHHLVPATLSMTAVAIALLAFSDRVADPIRAQLRDGLCPGLTALDSAVDSIRGAVSEWSGEPTRNGVAKERPPADRSGPALQQLRAANARLTERLANNAQAGTFPYRGSSSSPLVLTELVEARVLGRETAAAWRGGWLLNRGGRQGIEESALVVSDDAPLLDVGRDAKLEPGFAVFAGRTVVGRIRAVGRWSSTLEPLTAAGFRGHAQLIRKTSAGYAFGATGVIEGADQGGCKLKMIASAEPVSVGDGVYTLSNGGDFPFPMYYGRVIAAMLHPTATHWDIDVEPAAQDLRLRVVQVLRKRLDPRRVDPGSAGPRAAGATVRLDPPKRP
ncbi:MAG: rod shape-determining protein MreC [Planctomycetaceae bacterium]